MFQFSDEYIAELLRQIYAGEITAYDLPESLYHSIADNLKTALYEGFGGNLSKFADTPDFELLTELRENIYMFSAAKTFQQVKEISSQLTDGDRVRTRSEFNKIGAETFDKWNNDWGKSEYNTAVAQASMANKWANIQRSKDVLPNLSYSTSGGDVCDICAPLDGLTLPVDAPEWDTIYPPNHFNCMCIVTQEDDTAEISDPEITQDTYDEVTDKMSDVFMMNSGKDHVIFSDDHPYFDVAPKDVDFAKSNFGLPIPPVSDELPRNTRKEQMSRSENIIEDNLGLKPKKIVIADDLSLDTYTAMNDQLAALFNEYKVAEVYSPKATPVIKFKSTSRVYGQIASSNDGTYLEEINFGSQTSKDRIDDSAILRKKSRVDPENINLSTLTHEFAHLITVDRQQVRYATDERLKDFMPDLRAIKAKYLKEIKELYKKSSRIAELTDVYLGDYASTNINEFMAEAFTEYKLCKNPSKYAIEVGKLIDKTFKR